MDLSLSGLHGIYFRNRLERLEVEFEKLRQEKIISIQSEVRYDMSSEESSGLRMMGKQTKMLEELRFNYTTTASNITNIYSKIKALREANTLKCSKKKCDNINSKVKKTDTYVKFLADVNLTTLDMVLHNISRYTDTVNNLVTNLTDTVASHKTELDGATTKLNILARNVYSIMLPNVTSNSDFQTKVSNCFADINSADCPSSTLRHGKDIDRNMDEVNYGGQNHYTLRSYDAVKNSQTLGQPGRQSTMPLVPHLKIVLACMANNTDPVCTAQYR